MLGPGFQSLFENAEAIGSGGYAMVFRATSTVDRLDYAIKFIPFQRGAELGVLRHSNIVWYHRHWIEHVTGQEDRLSAFYIQTDLYARSLGDRLLDPVTLGESTKFIGQLLEAVHHIHQKCYIHNDINGNNILLDINGNVKVSDFGLARDCEEEVVLKSSEQGQVLYTPPERRREHIGSRAGDIFSLGILFFECLYSFNSGSERAQNIQALRDYGSLPNDWVDNDGLYTDFILKMVLHIPQQRPSIVELLEQFAAE